MRKLLWIGDAVAATGFARCTHRILDVVRQAWDVHVLGLNYMGDPHSYPYPVYPCWPGGDAFGLGRTRDIVNAFQPDLVVVQNDPWNVPAYLDVIAPRAGAKDFVPLGVTDWACPVAAAMPVDGKNLKDGEALNRLAFAVFWTEFGMREARAAGFEKPAVVVPLGVDLEIYRPIPRDEAREKLGLPDYVRSGFIVGNINRNQPRKRLDLTVECFARWLQKYGAKDAYLYLQLCPTGDLGYNVHQLKKYWDRELGLDGRRWLILIEPPIGQGVDEVLLPYVYSSFDVQLTTTQGEGWGLTTMEGMACGVPQIVPDWSALGEWPGDCVLGAKCSTTAVTPNKVNVIGGVPDREQIVAGLQALYTREPLRRQLSSSGLELVSRPQFRWEAIGERYLELLDEHVAERKEAVA